MLYVLRCSALCPKVEEFLILKAHWYFNLRLDASAL
jgi:hypothetical protein